MDYLTNAEPDSWPVIRVAVVDVSTFWHFDADLPWAVSGRLESPDDSLPVWCVSAHFVSLFLCRPPNGGCGARSALTRLSRVRLLPTDPLVFLMWLAHCSCTSSTAGCPARSSWIGSAAALGL